jgi:hypothetical protein
MKVTFGRYSDSFKTKQKSDFWRDAIELFEQKKYLDSYKSFVEYIRDDKNQNVTLFVNEGKMQIDFIQGTKLVRAIIDDKKVIAESDIALISKPGIAFMRRLLELNYGLFYTRFSLKDNMIILKFDSSVIDCSPSKLYFALKELALKADKQDDLLIKDFPVLQPIFEANRLEYSEEEKKTRYKYFKKWINDSIRKTNSLNEKSFEGGISYLLLSVIYKIDFMIVPEGNMINEIDNLTGIYFANDNKSFIDKNITLKDALQKLSEQPENLIIDSFYKTISSFSVLSPTSQNTVFDVIKDNIKNVKWYVDNKHEDIALSIYEYIFGYCLYHYGMVRCVAKMFRLAMILINFDFFKEISANGEAYINNDGQLNEVLIKEKINKYIDEAKTEYPELNFNISNLNFSSLLQFFNSFLKEIQTLNFNV